jgi:cell wall-associated NlpC family hydrolase
VKISLLKTFLGIGFEVKTNMKINIKYCSFLLLISLVTFACQPSVRYASKHNPDKKSNSKESIKNTKSDEPELKIIDKNKSYSDVEYSILSSAEKWIGIPYCSGGEDKNCTDCSGFTMSVFLEASIQLPRTAADQYEFSDKIDKKDAKKCDLVFFKNNSNISHVGIYIGDNKFIHASSSRGVIIESLELEYYKKHFAGFGRVIKKSS